MIGNNEHIDLLSAKHYLKEIGQQLTEADKVRLALMLPMTANRRKLTSVPSKNLEQDFPTPKVEHQAEDIASSSTSLEPAITELQNQNDEQKTKGENTSGPTRNNQLEAELNKQIASSAISAYIADEVDKIVPERKTETIKSKEEALPLETETNATEAEPFSGQKSFTSWLKDLDVEESNKPQPDAHRKRRAFDVIDSFISSNPQIVKNSSRENAAFFKASEHAKQSIIESDALYTETYANILEGQGNLKKAIEVLENLMLKFPEKSTYFARRIKAVEKQLNS